MLLNQKSEALYKRDLHALRVTKSPLFVIKMHALLWKICYLFCLLSASIFVIKPLPFLIQKSMQCGSKYAAF